MNRTKFYIALIALAIGALPVRAPALTYTATLLNSSGYSGEMGAYAASNTYRVGSGHRGTDLHALLWDSTNSAAIDLNPDQSGSEAYGVWGSTQVGFYSNQFTHGRHAALWYGSVESLVDLHPANYRASVAYSAWGTNQVGFAVQQTAIQPDHAMLWNGAAASAVDLNPPDAITSVARDLNATNQVGYSRVPSNSAEHATMWSGTAASAIDLNPPGAYSSRAYGIYGANQIGWAVLPQSNDPHALLWSGAAASFVDLQPADFKYSIAVDISAAGQAGYGGTWDSNGATQHALMWTGTAASAIDLHPLLNGLGPTFAASRAYGIADDGVVVGYATDTDQHTYAVMWTPVPEPTTCTLALTALVITAVRRRTDRRMRTHLRT